MKIRNRKIPPDIQEVMQSHVQDIKEFLYEYEIKHVTVIRKLRYSRTYFSSIMTHRYPATPTVLKNIRKAVIEVAREMNIEI